MAYHAIADLRRTYFANPMQPRIVDDRRRLRQCSQRVFERSSRQINRIVMGDDFSPLRVTDYEEVLREWLQWSDARERLAEELYQHRGDDQLTDELLNRIEEMRLAVIGRTKSLLSRRR